MLALPTAGLMLTFSRVGSRAGKGAWSWSEGHAERRALVVTTATAAVALAAFTWWPNGDYRPIQPGERGTIQGGLHSVAAIPSGRPSLTPARQRELGGAPTARQLKDDTRPPARHGRQRAAARQAGRRRRPARVRGRRPEPEGQRAAAGDGLRTALRARGRTRGASAAITRLRTTSSPSASGSDVSSARPPMIGGAIRNPK